MSRPMVSIIIVNYNKKEITLDCLKTLSNVKKPRFEIIVVDNGSLDHSADEISRRYPDVVTIRNKENLGFTGGNNAGLPVAKGKYVLLLNNDTKVTEDFLSPLVEDLEKNKDLGIVQSKMYVMDKPELLDNVVSYMTSTGFLYHRGYLDKDKPEYQSFIYSFSAKGACILIRREVLKMGLFDDDYFAFFEETDLCWRSWILGYKVGFEPRSVIYHKMGATSSQSNKYLINYHSFKNRYRTILKNASFKTILWMLPIHTFLCFSLAFYFLISRNRKSAGGIGKALWWNMINLGKTMSLRKKIQSSRVLSDEYIFSQVLKNPPLNFYLNHLSLVRQNLSK